MAPFPDNLVQEAKRCVAFALCDEVDDVASALGGKDGPEADTRGMAAGPGDFVGTPKGVVLFDLNLAEAAF
jgi:hypothetical protein